MRMPCRKNLQQNHLIEIKAYSLTLFQKYERQNGSAHGLSLFLLCVFNLFIKKHFILPGAEKN